MRLRASGPCALVLVAAVGLVPAGGAAHAADPVSTVTYGEADRAEALAYWTTDRMRKVGAAIDEGRTPAGQKQWTGARMAPVGRLFFVDEKGNDSWCTATSVPGENGSTAVTAGHCVQLPASPGNVHSSMVFVPGYSEGRQPHGAYAVRAFTMPRSWEQDDQGDVAAVVLDPREGRRLADAVGTLPVAFTDKPGGEVTLFGYPGTSPQRGEQLLFCTATARASEDHGQEVGCGMGGGASGGPWLSGFDRAEGRGTVVGMTSYGDSATESRTTSAEVLGPLARQVYDRAQGM
ncbi:peptidase [Streptomyces triticagri]|uniref:Peptidase n=1 Tax=Streptomyces triticagri TaxID=2293568 RepID=A0A372LX56_9ACTN|nr:peptidase [Streptomyces triticagri]RFU83236.1 peptidase [Streptomyces triticagri]